MSRRPKVPESISKKISAAQIGNKKAEKWDEKTVMAILLKMIEFLESDPLKEDIEIKKEETVIKGKQGEQIKKVIKTSAKQSVMRISTKLELIKIFKIKDRNWFSDMQRKFAPTVKNEDGDPVDNPNYSKAVSCMVDQVYNLVEFNLMSDAMSGAVVPNIAAMLLAKHYNYSTSKVENVNTNLDVSIDKPEVSDKIKEQWEKAKNYVEGAED